MAQGCTPLNKEMLRAEVGLPQYLAQISVFSNCANMATLDSIWAAMLKKSDMAELLQPINTRIDNVQFQLEEMKARQDGMQKNMEKLQAGTQGDGDANSFCQVCLTDMVRCTCDRKSKAASSNISGARSTAWSSAPRGISFAPNRSSQGDGSAKRRAVSTDRTSATFRDNTVLHLVNFPFAMKSADLNEAAKAVIQPLVPNAIFAMLKYKSKTGTSACSIFFPSDESAKDLLEKVKEQDNSICWVQPGTGVNLASAFLHLKPDQSLQQRAYGKALSHAYSALKTFCEANDIKWEDLQPSSDKNKGILYISVGIRLVRMFCLSKHTDAPMTVITFATPETGLPNWITQEQMQKLATDINLNLDASV